MPPADLRESDWTVRHGQAVWTLPHQGTELAGDLIVATRHNETFVQFSKTPIPFVTARAQEGRWEIVIHPQNRRYARPGSPPRRLIWLQLARVLAGGFPPEDFTWNTSQGSWRLENRSTHEAVEGYFEP